MHPVLMARTSQMGRDSETSAARRSSMTNSRCSETTHVTRRYTTNSMQLGETVDRLRLLDSSVYSSEKDAALSRQSNVAVSVPPIAVPRGLIGQRTSSANVLNNYGHPASTAEINHKVVQMMAATDALKPSTPTRRETRFRASAQVAQSRGFSKLLGRIYSKSASPESEALKKRSKVGRGEKVAPLKRSVSQPDRNKAAISSTEIRLNEDQNLGRDKVQQMMGVQEICNPANTALVSHHAYAQFTMGVAPEEDQPSFAESRNMSWSSTNPFDTEEDFEGNLDQGILHASPAGSSTPRIRIYRSSDSSPSVYSIPDLSDESLEQVKVAKVVQFGKSDKINEPIRQVKLGPALDKGRSPRECLSADEYRGNAKKHPSPSKRDLEELEKALRQYELPPATSQDGDADELAVSPAVLFARGRN
ncbi:hypothetical protein E4U41_007543 [Claviceps citrina]|nr:hypothetical protein E4U41_007543 [Claviceps citrina]